MGEVSEEGELDRGIGVELVEGTSAGAEGEEGGEGAVAQLRQDMKFELGRKRFHC